MVLFTSHKKLMVLLISIAIMTGGILFTAIFTFFADPVHPYTIIERTLTTSDGVRIQAVIYTPIDVSGDHYGIVNSHGFCGNKRWNQALSIELVKRGFVVVNIDNRGHGASEGYLDEGLPLDIMTAIDYLQNLSYVKLNEYGLVGHSMGGGNSLSVANSSPTLINATVAIGSVTSAYNSSTVRNLMMIMGRFEQSQYPADLITFLKKYTGLSDVSLGVQYGDFAQGNATKAVLGLTEHDTEPWDPIILYETVQWFEIAFYGSVRFPITITVQYLIISISTAMVGCVMLVFIVIVYLGGFLFKKKQRDHPEIPLVKDQSVLKPAIAYFFIAPLVGLLMMIPLSVVLSDIIPIDMFSSVYSGLAVGKAIGILIILLIFFTRNENGKRSLKPISTSFKEMVSTSPGRSLIYGALAGVFAIVSISFIAHWTFNTSPLTTMREIGVIFSMTVLFFPFLLVKEFYLRIVQERLRASKRINGSRIKEYFSMFGIGFLMDWGLFILLLIPMWQSPIELLAGLSFILFPVTLFDFCRHVMVPWVYQNSGRNILGSTLFYSIFWAFMVIGFFPFGVAMSAIAFL